MKKPNLCRHCRRTLWDHQARTHHCPIGKKSRIGFIGYHKVNVFTPQPPPPATPPERADFLAACGRVGERMLKL